MWGKEGGAYQVQPKCVGDVQQVVVKSARKDCGLSMKNRLPENR